MAQIVAPLVIPTGETELDEELQGLRDKVRNSEVPGLDWGAHFNIYQTLADSADRFPDRIRTLWVEAAEWFDPCPF